MMYRSIAFFLFVCFLHCEARPPGYDSWRFLEGTSLCDHLFYREGIEKLSEAIDCDDIYYNAYIERAGAYFELGFFELALRDYTRVRQLQYGTVCLNDQWEFSRGIFDGIHIGARECHYWAHGCLKGITFGLWAFVCKPHEISRELTRCLYDLGDYLRNCERQEWCEFFIPEVRECVRMWDCWSDAMRGQKMGFIIGRYGIHIFGSLMQERGIEIFRCLKRANTLAILSCLASPINRAILLKEVDKRVIARNHILHSIKCGKIIPADPNVIFCLPQKECGWHHFCHLIDNPEEDFNAITLFLENECIYDTRHFRQINSLGIYEYRKIIGNKVIEAFFKKDPCSGALFLKNAYVRDLNL